MTQKERRAEFLIRWFLDVFNGHKAPYPRRCFRGIAYHMEEFVKSSPALLRGTGEGEDADTTPPAHEEHDAEVELALRHRS